MLCVRPSPRHAWVPVPVTIRGKAECVVLCSTKSPWVQKCLVGAKKGTDDRDWHDVHLVLKAFESTVREKILNPQVDIPKSKNVDPREQLLGSSDDEDISRDSPPTGSEESPKKTRRLAARSARAARRTAMVATEGFTMINVGDDQVEVGFHKGPGLQLAATVDAVRLVLKFLNEKYDTLLTAGRELHAQKTQRGHDCPHELLRPVKRIVERTDPHAAAKKRLNGQHKSPSVRNGTIYMNKIRWDFARTAFSIHYMDDDGKQCRATKGFEVPLEDRCGRVMTGESYSEAKAIVFQNAIEYWNTHDKSKQARIIKSEHVFS